MSPFAMDFCFGFVAIFLIHNVASVRPQDSKKNKVTLSPGIANNPFLQLSNFSTTQTNPFLLNNREESSFLPNNVGLQRNKSNPFLNTNNPFLFPSDGIKMGTQSTISPRPTATQRPPYHHTLASIIPVSNTPTPVDHHFTMSHMYTPPRIHTHTVTVSPLSYQELIESKLNPVPQSISERKCDEYIEEIWGVTWVSSLAGSSSGPIKVPNDCGNANRLIVKGVKAGVGEFPHMVALGVPDSNQFTLTCGGTLISHTWVLTAAHCTFGQNNPTHARIGFHKLSDLKTGVMIPIKNKTVHEDYKHPVLYADISLIQLMDAVTFSTTIRPACLYQQYDTVPQKAWASGWGITEYAGDPSDELQKVQLDLIDNLFCTIRHNTSADIPDGVRPSMLCAGDSRSWSKDTCQGDSGGPLQIYPDTKCLFQVIGITSFGQDCASGLDIPAVYTRVPYYIPWIEEHVWPQGR